ncbi:unnamed protein product [Rotaria sp. Silwood2]|nr:unnamed protein product [Rotaria sp. Silwood2]CAF2756268.1 unnamed protein product [Rotaria sp. Silwood2]CAF4015010.1 unnamed protein product [Rotaria sp. Silwood2]CAF4306874.1 unnamed protein product [Rotaria sp. Silwood2]
MKLSEYIENDTNLFIDECKPTSCLPNNHHSSIQRHSLQEKNLPCSIDNKSLPSSEYIYTEFVKAIGNNEFIEEKRLLKRASWGPNEQQAYGLPPTGKRTFGEPTALNKNFNRVRMRSKATRNYQLQQPNQIIHERPYSFNDKYDHILIDKLSNQTLNRNGILLNEQRDSSPTPSSSSMDSVLQIKTRASPSFDNSDFISDTSTASSMTTVTSLGSNFSSRRRSPIYDHIISLKTRPLISEYQQKDLNHIDYKFLSPILNTNTTPLSSPVSSLSSSSSISSTYFTSSKGHEESSPSSSPIGSSLNQYTKFTLQTPTTDSSRDNDGHSTTTNGIMNMSMSLNRYNNQTHSPNSIITSNSAMTNNHDGLKQQREQTSLKTIYGSCLKSHKKDINNNNNNNNNNQIKKSVHFGWHLPKEIRSTSPSTHCNYLPSVTVTSSSSSTGNSNSDNDIQTKKNYGEKVEEKEKIETTRRTINTATPLSTNTIHRSFSLSPSPLVKEENNDRRRHRQEKKENVDELKCTTSGRVTTAATHFHCATKAATVTFNDGNQNISSTKEPNGTNNFSTSGNLTHSSADKQMPLNTLLVKNSINNPQTTTKKFTSTGGFFNFINRSNNSNNHSSSNNENKQLKRSSSIQQKSKQHKTHGNKRLSADIDTLRSPLISSNNAPNGDVDKVTMNYQEERQSTTDNNTHFHYSCNTNSSTPLCTNTKMNRSSTSMSMNPTTITVKSDEGDSLNNGLLFQPVQSIEKEPFFLSPPKSLSNNDESSSSIGKMMQTSTLIISTPPQYHYYLYPPTSISKKNLTTNRSISNVSMNSISTNSSSSNASYESQAHDFDEDTLSYSTYSINNQKHIRQLKSSSNTKPVILSDSVQAFWPPPPSSSILKNIPEQTIMASTVEQNKHSNSSSHKHKQSQSSIIQNNVISSTYNDESSSISNGNQTDVLPPTTSLILNNKHEVRSYAEQNSFPNGCLRIASDTSLEDTQASYSERLREKSRSIKTTNRLGTMNINNNNNNLLSRSRSKDTLDNQYENSNSINKNLLRPKSANQVRVQALLSPTRHEILDDFQSKRQFFENRTYTDYTPASTNNKTYALSPSNTISNNNYQRSETK